MILDHQLFRFLMSLFLFLYLSTVRGGLQGNKESITKFEPNPNLICDHTNYNPNFPKKGT